MCERDGVRADVGADLDHDRPRPGVRFAQGEDVRFPLYAGRNPRLYGVLRVVDEELPHTGHGEPLVPRHREGVDEPSGLVGIVQHQRCRGRYGQRLVSRGRANSSRLAPRGEHPARDRREPPGGVVTQGHGSSPGKTTRRGHGSDIGRTSARYT